MSAGLTTAGAATRQSILRAARRLFVTQGFVGSSVRSIAAEAQTDPALVIRHFGSKEQLFLEAMDAGAHFDGALAGPLDGLGPRLVEQILGPDSALRFTAYRSMMRASECPLVRERLNEVMEEMFIRPLAPRLHGPDAELRARLVAAQVAGLLDALAIMSDEQIRAADTASIARLYGRAIQSLVDGPPSAAVPGPASDDT